MSAAEGAGSPEQPAPALSGEDTQALISSAREGRLADQELATALRRPVSSGAGATTGYLDSLARRMAPAERDEHELVLAAKSGDAGARAQLVEAFLPLVASVARFYRETPRVSRLELLQEGVVGLLRALERYEPGLGVPFWGYAVWWVRQAMQQLVAELSRPTVMSDRALRQLARARRAARRGCGGSAAPSARDLAGSTGLAVEQVETLLAVDSPARSLDEPVSSGEGTITALGELIEDPLPAR